MLGRDRYGLDFKYGSQVGLIEKVKELKKVRELAI